MGKKHSSKNKGRTSEHRRTLMYLNVFAKAVRAQWGIENNLHWCLDVVYLHIGFHIWL
jgi:predicted transposase YbfD/YdcC